MPSLLVTMRQTIVKLRPYIVAVFIIAFCITPLIPSPGYKMTIAASLGLTVLYLLFDIHRELMESLDGIKVSLKEPNPPSYQDFSEASAEMDRVIISRLKANKDVHIRVLGVSAQYSWKHLVEDKLPKFLEMGNKRQEIHIEFVIVDPIALKKMKQTKLMADTERTLRGVELMKYKAEYITERLTIDVFKFNNIPHWHGVLIDDDTLFMGTCKWNISGKNYELVVGTNEYRFFELNDRFKGSDSVDLFINWFEVYKLQGNKIQNAAKVGERRPALS